MYAQNITFASCFSDSVEVANIGTLLAAAVIVTFAKRCFVRLAAASAERNLCGLAIVGLGLCGILAAPASAQVRVVAEWHPNSDGVTAGYRVFVATAAGLPLGTLDAGPATSVVLPLPAGARYLVTVRGYGAAGQHGPPSAGALVDLSAAPGAPENFAVDINGPLALLSWSAPASGGMALTYLLSVGTTPGASNVVHETSIGDVRTASGELPPGRYYTRLRAASLLGASPATPEVVFDVGGGFRPLAPWNLAATWHGAALRVTWSAPDAQSPGEAPTSYVLEVGSRSGAADLGAANVGDITSFEARVPPRPYYIRVRGANGRGLSDASNEVTVRPDSATGPPTSLMRAVSSAGIVHLSWRSPAGRADSYVVEVGTAPGRADIGAVNVGSTTSFSTPAPAGAYYVRVRAVGAHGPGAPSNEVLVQR